MLAEEVLLDGALLVGAVVAGGAAEGLLAGVSHHVALHVEGAREGLLAASVRARHELPRGLQAQTAAGEARLLQR